MEEIIREIVDADKQARALVKQKQQERQNIQNLIQDKKEEIKKKYQMETKELLATRKKQLDAELEQETKKEELAYQDALAQLQKKYDAKKQDWVDAIIKRCLAS